MDSGGAAGDPNRKDARSALVSLCENYWYPLYAYLRRRGYSADEAQDLTQEFFVRVLEGRYLDRADPEKGRFRSFILTSLKFFVADEAGSPARAANAAAEWLCPLNSRPGKSATSASLRTMRRRSGSSSGVGRSRCLTGSWRDCGTSSCITAARRHFERLKVFLLGQSDAPYAALAREMNTSEGALKVAIHRLRKRYRELFRQEIADTVADPAEVESELRFLAAVLTRK